MKTNLPDEIWSQIFDTAADEDILFQPGFPTVMAESAWYKDYFVDTWRLRSPQEAMNFLQRRSFATKKAIISTCRQWRALGSEFLFRCLYFSDPAKILELCSILDTSASATSTITSSYGWWTRRIHLARYRPSDIDFESALVSIIRHCPNLEIFVVERDMTTAFGSIVDALATYASKKLHTVQWNVRGESLSKVIWGLNALPHLIAIHIDIESPVPAAQEIAHLGAAANLPLHLPRLQQLFVRGYVEQLVEQAAGWDMPVLRSFSVDSGQSSNDIPDVMEFLRVHGLSLMLLDLDCAPGLSTASILGLCPNLTTFTFNADWRIPVGNSVVSYPHPHIHSIGLHGLSSAFGLGLGAQPKNEFQRVRVDVTCKANDLNMEALNRRNFPKLVRIRALSRTVLNELNRADGPSVENGGYDRWNRWWSACAAGGIRLEDCTGDILGTLPQDEPEDSEDEDEDEDEDGDGDGEDDDDEEEDDDDDEEDDEQEGEEMEEQEINFAAWSSRVGRRVGPPLPEGNGRTMELTRLLQECREMNEGRDEELIARIRIPRPDSPL